MESGNSEFMSEAESRDILERNRDEIEEILDEIEPGKYALKRLMRTEKKEDTRKEVLELLGELYSEEKVLDKLSDLSHQLSDTEELLDKLDSGKKIEDIEKGEVLDKTVKELRSFLKNNKLTEMQLQKLLEKEKSNKDRKTAKKYIKKEIKSSDNLSSLENLQKDLSKLKEDLSKVKAEVDKNREEFNFPSVNVEVNTNLKENLDTEKNQKELLEVTNSVIEKLRENNDLRNNKQLKKLVNDAFLALEAEKYSTFKDKMQEIENLGTDEGLHTSSSQNLANQEEKLERMENVVSELEERQKEELGIPGENSKEVNENLEKLEESSGIEIERPEKVAKEKKIEELVSKGFDEEDLRTRSYSDLRKLEESSEEVDDFKSKLKEIEEGQFSSTDSDSDTKNEIEANIEKLEESLDTENEESSSSLTKLEEKLSANTESEEKGLLGLI